jgi:methyl-accepting chemotaxis protein
MKWNVGTRIAAGFGLTLAIFMVVGAVSYRGVNELIEVLDLRRQSFTMLNHLRGVRESMFELESAQRSYLLTGEASYHEAFGRASREAESAMAQLRRQASANPAHGGRLDAIESTLHARIAFARESLEAGGAQGTEAGARAVRSGKGKELMHEFVRLTNALEADEENALAARTRASDASAAMARWTILGGTLAGLVLASIAGLLITRSIAVPLQQLTNAAERIREGDLDAPLPDGRRGDEVGSLARAFAGMKESLISLAGAAERIAAGDLRATVQPRSQRDVLGIAFARMVENLREQIRAVAEGTVVLGSAASQIVASTSQFAASATESAAAVTETTTTVEEVRQTAHLASQKAQHVSETSQKAALVSQRGRRSAEDVTQGIERIRRQMEAIASSMMRLSEQSHAIGQIIAAVEDLAAQSNLLAVNAAMEAAKAGESGRGFAVVAQEVKSLAEQSRHATNQIRGILVDIQKATSAAVLATEEGGKAVDAGSEQTAVAGEAIRGLAESVSEAAHAATQIAASSQQQLVGVDQVAGAMTSILGASNQNVESARQLEVAARDLNDLGQRLKKAVERYQV